MTQYPDPAAANLNDGFVVSINIVAKEGEADAVAEILERLIAPTMAEEGVKFFMPYRHRQIQTHFLSTSYTEAQTGGMHTTSQRISKAPFKGCCRKSSCESVFPLFLT